MSRSAYCALSKKAPGRPPDIRPRELKDETGWYVFVDWGDRPAEQVGGFASENEAQNWIDCSVFDWLKKRFEAPELRLSIR